MAAVALSGVARRLMGGQAAAAPPGDDAADGGPPPPPSSSAEAEALRRELLELRASNRHLQEVLHAAQAGSVAMRGFLSKHRAGVAGGSGSGGSGGDGSAAPSTSFVPWAGLFAQEWELRFFILSGTLLRWFKSDRDVALAPRGALDVQGCLIEIEGGGGGGGGRGGRGNNNGGGNNGGNGSSNAISSSGFGSGPFRFRLVEPPLPGRPGTGGKVLLRLSSDNRLAAEQWVTALEAAGVRVAASGGRGAGGASSSSRPASASRQQQQQQQQQPSSSAYPPAAVQDRWEQSSVDSELPETLPQRRGAAAAAAPAAAAARPPTTGGGALSSLRWAAGGGGAVGASTGSGARQRAVFQGGGGSGGGGGSCDASPPPRPARSDGGGGGGADSPGLSSPPHPPSRARAAAVTPLPTVPSGAPVDHGAAALPLSPAAAAAANAQRHRRPSADGGGRVSPTEEVDAASLRLVAHLKRHPMSGSTPVYTASRGSYLSSDGVWAARHDGLLNLGILLLVIGNLRLILENLIRYGIRVDPVRYVRASLYRKGATGNLPLVLCFPLLVLAAMAAVGVERLALALARRDAHRAAQIRKLAPSLSPQMSPGQSRSPSPTSRSDKKNSSKGGGGGVGGGGGKSKSKSKGGSAAAARGRNGGATGATGVGRSSSPAAEADAAAAALALAADTAAGRRGSEALVLALQFLVTSVALVAPSAVVVLTKADITPALLLTMCAIVTWAKLVSYHHCGHDCRSARRAGEPPRPGERGAPEVADVAWAVLRYPENLTPLNMLWFLATPTMTYQVNFPRSDRIRKRWLLRRVAELLLGVGFALVIVDQYMAPACANALAPIAELDALRMAERVLKLALPNLYVWLVIFYCLFHSWCNVLAELTRFGDREFYKDWWNAATLGDYWRAWNIPVHKWVLRTVYFPAMTKLRMSRYGAMVLTFFVSAVMHELAIGVPLRMVRGWAFAGIMFQVPLITLTEALRRKIKSDALGNMIFWCSFCVFGQPVAVLAYFHDYMVYKNAARAAAIARAAAGPAAVGLLLPDLG